MTGEDDWETPGLLLDWYDIPTGWGQLFRGDLLKWRTNLKTNPERLILRGKPRRQGSGNMAMEKRRERLCLLSFLSFSPPRSFIQPGRRNEWELLRASSAPLQTVYEHRQESLFLFLLSFRHAIHPREPLRERENFPPSLIAFLLPRFEKIDSSHPRILAPSIVEWVIPSRDLISVSFETGLYGFCECISHTIGDQSR